MISKNIDDNPPGSVTGTLGKVFRRIVTTGHIENKEIVLATLEYINLNKPHHMYVKVQLEGDGLSTPFFVGELFKSITRSSPKIAFDGHRFRFNLGNESSISFIKEDLFVIVPKLKSIISKAQTPKGKKPDVFVRFS